MKTKIIILLIFLLAAFFRIYGLDWDEGQHLHPDERFLTMVTNSISWPKNISEYLNSSTSPLNPHNKGWGFFVYGTFPLFLTKLITDITGTQDYNNVTLMGRLLSALFDLGTLVLVYKIAQTIKINSKFEYLNSKQSQNSNFRNSKRFGHLNLSHLNLFRISDFGFRIFPLSAMFFYAISVLPIQLSHFYAVDTYLTFFLTLSFYFLVKIINNPKPTIHHPPSTIYHPLLGISFGLAIASKISALLFLPIIGLGYLFFFFKQKNLKVFLLGGVFAISCYFTVRLAQPYLFQNPNLLDLTLNQKVLDNWKELKSYDGPDTVFPPALQWIPTKPYFYPLLHTIIWGLGLPLGVICFLALIYLIFTNLFRIKPFFSNQQSVIIRLLILWVLILFIYQGSQFPKALRYLYSLYPSLTILCAFVLGDLLHKSSRSKKINSILYLYLVFCLFWTLSFMSIYQKPHSRVQASTWIYQNIPINSLIATEYWDDGLPLYLEKQDPKTYRGISLPLYDYDSKEKWEKIAQDLTKTDYIILSSNRLWRSLSALPEKYPLTSKYYQALFNESLGFKKIAVFSAYQCLIPQIPNTNYKMETTSLKPSPISLTVTDYCWLALNDDGAEESFTVYDHPKVIIFEKTPQFSQELLFQMIGLPL